LFIFVLVIMHVVTSIGNPFSTGKKIVLVLLLAPLYCALMLLNLVEVIAFIHLKRMQKFRFWQLNRFIDA